MPETKKTQKKSFFEVKVPLTAAKIYLYGNSVEELSGKVVKLDMTRSLRGKSIELKIKIKAENGQLIGNPASINIIGSYIRKMMRNSTDYVEDSFIADCKDCKVRIKPFMITRNKVSRALRKALRDYARNYLISYLKTRDIKEIFSETISNKIQKEMSLKLKKIYPLVLCEIRCLEIQ
ncbi:MAG: hypothetical protein AABW65_00845 [Nanoarchaeota archaeon]